MTLPRVKIYFENGLLGSVADSADGLLGLAVTATAVAGKFELARAYVLRSLSGLDDLGITADEADANAFLYKQVKEFYAEAGEGTAVWLMGFPNTVSQSAMVDKTQNYAKLLIQEAEGALKGIIVAINPATGYVPTIEDGLDADLKTAMSNAQELAEWATTSLYAPLFVILEARHFSGNVADLLDLTDYSYNRVGVLMGDTANSTNGAAVGTLAGRIASNSVQRHIGRVKDGALAPTTVYIVDKTVSQADVESINDKGFITFRTFVGKAGYFFADDSLATETDDDYRSLARRRTIDKAYRVAYAALLEELNDEIALSADGTIAPAIAKSWEQEVETAIINNMTANGNLGVDPTDDTDTGVQCAIDTTQNVVSSSKIEIVLRVKPYGYAKYIDVKLGFKTTN